MAFNFFSLVPGIGEEYEHVATYATVSLATIAVGLGTKIAMKNKGEASVTPDGKLSLRGVFEMITEFISGNVEMVIGHHGRKYTPFFCAIFTFILVNNFVGMIPGMTPATEQINTTLAMGTFMFLVYNYMGLKENGLGYLKHFLGPIWWLAWFMAIVELISHVVRPLSLGLRLSKVMSGDHIVIGIFTDLVPIALPVPFYLLGMLVCFVQAFVFTLLSMVYIALATAHDH